MREKVREGIKSLIIKGLVSAGADWLFRTVNRRRLLVVMYHGVTRRSYVPKVWTQLPLPLFRAQLEFLKRHYRLVTLPQVLQALEQEGTLPERAALITFDDGLSNNYSIAYPVLKELGVPAAIFLTVDLIGTSEILWVDELYLLLREGASRGMALRLPVAQAQESYAAGELWEAYVACVERAKRGGAPMRQELMETLRAAVSIDRDAALDDFGFLNWEEVREMEGTGLVRCGVHTATHRILSELTEPELEDEVLAPRKKFLAELRREPESFCYPNGIPGVDFDARHQAYLRSCGYRCAFSTEQDLFRPGSGERMGIARIPAGNDGNSHPDYFMLNTAGAFQLLRRRAATKRRG